MYALIQTYRLGSMDETISEVQASREHGWTISDQSARTIASWYHSPSPSSQNITRLSHGLPFDTKGLLEEVERDVTDPWELDAMIEWIDNLEAHLEDA